MNKRLISLFDVFDAFDVDYGGKHRPCSKLAWVTLDGVIHLFFTMK